MASKEAIVSVVNNGNQAIDLFKENDFDLILMDIHMPELNGIEAMVRIRSWEDDVKATVPIIALTADNSDDHKVQYISLGMDDSIAKPLDESILIEKIFAILNQKELNNSADLILFLEDGLLFDYSKLSKISQGNRAFELKLMKIFIDTVPDEYAKLEIFWRQKDFLKVGETAHKLKTTIVSLRIDQLKDSLKLLEQNCTTGNVGDQTYLSLLKVINTLKAIVKEFKEKVI